VNSEPAEEDSFYVHVRESDNRIINNIIVMVEGIDDENLSVLP
jgi:hypothetical protein